MVLLMFLKDVKILSDYNKNINKEEKLIMAKTMNNNTPIVNTTITEPKPANTPSSVQYALSITCLCGGRYVPLTHKIADVNNVFYRCTKCGRDINIKRTPITNK